MERFVVTCIRGDVWSVSHQGEPPSVYPTEAEALSATFAAASTCKRAGINTTIVIMQARAGDEHPNHLIRPPTYLFPCGEVRPIWRR
jgi:hypothetical protein